MKNQNKVLFACFALLIITLTLVLTACEAAAPIKIKNETSQALTIFINEREIGIVKPGEEIENENLLVSTALSKYLVEAKDTQGNLIYSREFSARELRSQLNWKVVIPPTK